MNKVTILILISILSFPSFAKVNLDELLDRIDRVYKSDSSMVTMEMIIETPHWKRSLELKSWTKGLEKTFITVLAPRKEKGISTLKIENEMWNYFPRVNKVIKVPPSMMMGQWMGSDFTNDDLVKENTYRQDYISRLLNEEGDIVTVELKPKPHTITVWEKLILVIDKKKLIPIKQDYYGERGELVRQLLFDQVQRIGKYLVPMRLVLTPFKKPGHKTTVLYKEMKLNAKVKDSIFSMSNLQKRR